ncbi:MAG: DUF4905 domain-containing protein [Ignavibacteriaceae bacterium]|nr:DUF4905 domain-containing protein [Ignavibacteriaceae bacterium]
MSKIKKAYGYSRDRLIWRLIPANTDKLIIEERDTSTKEVFFNCIDINSGKKIFYDFQLEEKYWAGIETIYNDVIIFHKYTSREMPEHDGMIAYDINSGKILWENNDYVFLFIYEDKIYCYRNIFEGREFFTINLKTGIMEENLSDDASRINSLRENSFNVLNTGNYLFPEYFYPESMRNTTLGEYFSEYRTENVIAGRIEYIKTEDMLLFSSHSVNSDGSLKNIFKAVEFTSKKVIFEEILNQHTGTFIPDCFFIKDKFFFLLIEKTKLKVCSIKK